MAQLDKIQTADIELFLSKMIDMPCWAIVAGEGTGSMVLMSFGKKFLRKIPVDNDTLSHNAKNFDAELSLFITNAEWQLLNLKDNSLICDCFSSNKKNGEMDRGLSQLIDKKVKSTVLDWNCKDFEIDFEGELKLCVISSNDQKTDETSYKFEINGEGRK